MGIYKVTVEGHDIPEAIVAEGKGIMVFVNGDGEVRCHIDGLWSPAMIADAFIGAINSLPNSVVLRTAVLKRLFIKPSRGVSEDE